MLLLLLAAGVAAQQLAFPGAAGFGRFATGGRGGTVVHVTNLNDSGAGSFREAVGQPNRVVVFDVAGIIRLESRLVFAKNLTVAGQTAPGDGVVVYGDGVSFSGADNLICRYMRFRMGAGGTAEKDAAGIANGRNMIFDHVSVTWGRDETFSISWDNKGTEPTNITIQNSIIGQGLLPHSAGGLVQTSGGVTLWRNLYIDNHTRNPKVKGLNQFVNNVVYNWGGGGCYILGDSEGTSWATIVNNYFIKGPSSSGSAYSRANENFQLYAAGNYVDGNLDGLLNGTASVKSDYGPAFWVDDPAYWTGIPASDPDKIPQTHPLLPEMTGAEEAYGWIVKNAGATLPARDQVDAFLIGELVSLGKKGATISSESMIPSGGPGMLFRGDKLPDSDNDGMPDRWEEANGTLKNENDAALLREDGYTNIEHYIHSIVSPVAFLKYPVSIGASALTSSSVTLKWVNPEEKATRIVIRYGEGEAFTDSLVVGGQATSALIEGLKNNTLYTFRLLAANDSLRSQWSDPWPVTTSSVVIPPLACINPSPADGTTLKNNRDILLAWENKTGVMAGTLYFDLLLGKSEETMEPVVLQSTLYNFSIPELEENSTWYWRVRTTNLLGVHEGVTWSFTTGPRVVRTLVLHLPFDEMSGSSAADITGQYTATAWHFTPSWVTGIMNHCLCKPGTPANGHLLMPHFPALYIDRQPFTISLWFKSPGGIADSYLFHKGMHDHTNGGAGRWSGIQYKGTTLTFAIDDDVTKSAVNVAGANQWFNDQWHHLACVRDPEAGKLMVYVDGVKKGETADNTGGIGETGNLVLGNRNGYFDNPYPGCLDELKIWSDALTASEISQIYSANLTVVPQALLPGGDLRIWPNPFYGHLTVALPPDAEGQIVVAIYDLTGQWVAGRTFYSLPQNRAGISGLEELTPGMYQCVVTTGNRRYSTKIVKAG